MFNIFAHAGHSHEITSAIDGMSDVDHCMPIIIGAATVVIVLVGIIAYLLMNWQPKKATKTSKKKSEK